MNLSWILYSTEVIFCSHIRATYSVNHVILVSVTFAVPFEGYEL